jgi:hypothetical protein
LPSGPSVELIDGALERGFADERDDQDVGRDIPRLVGDDTNLHGGEDPPGMLAASGAPSAAVA